MKIFITEVTIEDVELEFDRLGDGTKTNFRYAGNISAIVASNGKMTEDEFRQQIFETLLSK